MREPKQFQETRRTWPLTDDHEFYCFASPVQTMKASVLNTNIILLFKLVFAVLNKGKCSYGSIAVLMNQDSR